MPRSGNRGNVGGAGQAQRKRIKYIRFVPAYLAERLDALAAQRKSRFSWAGNSYTALSRSQAPNQESLNEHATALQHFVAIAPNGFPSHVDTRATFAILHAKHNILQAGPGFEHKIIDEAADAWRIITTHFVCPQEKR